MDKAPHDRRVVVATLAGVAILAYLADLATKTWALNSLGNGRVLTVIPGVIRFELIANPGAAFSLGGNVTWVFTILSVAVSAAVVIVARRVRSRAWAVALGMILAGALGNLTDRLARPPGFPQGQVVDFIAYGTLFIGNVADIAICASAVLIVIYALRGIRPWDQA